MIDPHDHLLPGLDDGPSTIEESNSFNARFRVLSSAVIEAGKIVGEERARKMVTEYPQAILDGVRPDIH